VLDDKPDFSAILAELAKSDVQYVLIGGLAMVAHGSSHITTDVDISYERGRKNLIKLAGALAGFHPALRDIPPGLPFVLDVRSLSTMTMATLTTDVGDIDLLAEPPGVSSFDNLWRRSKVVEIFGVHVHIASLEDLIAMKQAANRPKDQAQVAELMSLQKLLSTSDAGDGFS
jgi:predicted nucleotidyltransferase